MEHFLRCHFWLWRIFKTTSLWRFDHVLPPFCDQFQAQKNYCLTVGRSCTKNLWTFTSQAGKASDSWCRVWFTKVLPTHLAQVPSANSVWLVDGWRVGHFVVFWAPQACEVPKANLSAPFGMSDWMTTQRGWLVHGSWSRRWLNENHFFFHLSGSWHQPSPSLFTARNRNLAAQQYHVAFSADQQLLILPPLILLILRLLRLARFSASRCLWCLHRCPASGVSFGGGEAALVCQEKWRDFPRYLYIGR